MSQIPDVPGPGPLPASGSGLRQSLTFLDVVLVCALAAAFIMIPIAAFTVASIRHGGFDETVDANATLAVLFLEAAGIFAAAYLILIVRRGFTWADLGFRPVRLSWTGVAVLAALGCLLFAGAVSQIVERYYQTPLEEEYMATLAPTGLSPLRVALLYLSAGVLVPPAEELLFRGIIYPWLRQYLGVASCVVISAGLFSLAHQNLRLAIQIFIVGIVLALLYERSRSLLVSTVTHMTVNIISLTIIFVYSGPSVPA